MKHAMAAILGLWLAVVAVATSAQEWVGVDGVQDENGVRHYYVYRDDAQVHATPDASGRVLERLNPGDPVSVQAVAKQWNAHGGISGNWLSIRYEKAGRSVEGYLWQADLATYAVADGDEVFVIGVDRYVPDQTNGMNDMGVGVGRFHGQVKAVRDGRVLDSKPFDFARINGFYAESYAPVMLTGVQRVIYFFAGGEACSIPTEGRYFAWTGEHLLKIADSYSDDDEDRNITPLAGSKWWDLVFMVRGVRDADADETEPFRYEVEVFRWDGTRLVSEDAP